METFKQWNRTLSITWDDTDEMDDDKTIDVCVYGPTGDSTSFEIMLSPLLQSVVEQLLKTEVVVENHQLHPLHLYIQQALEQAILLCALSLVQRWVESITHDVFFEQVENHLLLFRHQLNMV